jgi:hypothetical protein
VILHATDLDDWTAQPSRNGGQLPVHRRTLRSVVQERLPLLRGEDTVDQHVRQRLGHALHGSEGRTLLRSRCAQGSRKAARVRDPTLGYSA